MKKCEVVVIIPARIGSSRLPNKPLRKICGKPMIQHVYQCGQQCPDVSQVIVATDDQRVVQLIEEIGGKAILTEANLPSGSDRVAVAAQKMNLSDDTVIVNIQGDQPLMHPQSLSALVKPFVLNQVQENEMATLSFAMPIKHVHDTSKVKVVCDKNGYALYFSRSPIPFGRDEWLPTCLVHIGVYAYTHKFLKIFSSLETSQLEDTEKLEQLRVLEHGYQIKVINSDYDSPEVDVEEDIVQVEKAMRLVEKESSA